ncbi:MAG: hypothetical protein KDC99_19545 [Cyclobacteriaceae bacterium]|nr:hypothetical protein [Cyclobacteriaceae bacterium]
MRFYAPTLFIVIFFIGCAPTIISRAPVRVHSTEEYTYFDSPGGRTYLSYWLNVGYNFPWDSIAPAKAYYSNALSEVGLLFSEGILTAQMFRGAYLDSTGFGSQAILNWSTNPGRDTSSFIHSLESFDGPILKIITYSMKLNPQSKLLILTIGGTIHKDEDGWGSTSYWTVSLKSRSSTAHWNEFVTGIYDVKVTYDGEVL